MHKKGFILIAETDDLIQQLLERWLEEVGYTVVTATTSRPPRQDTPRLVIANISSPRSAAAMIRSLQAQHAAPILLLSARFRRGLGASAEAAERLGVRKVLPKPFTREELLAAVGESVGGP